MQDILLWPIRLLFALWRLIITGSVQQPRIASDRTADDRTAKPRKFGLHQVYPDPNDTSSKTDIDIVAIHGLDTQSPQTWVTWKDGVPGSEQVHWLQDQNMLPSIIPNARIFTYDWNANINKDAADEGLFGHANGLLEDLHISRSVIKHLNSFMFAAEPDDRVGQKQPTYHLRCLLLRRLAPYQGPYSNTRLETSSSTDVRKALHQASESHSEYRDILESTAGVVFLGTPFQGGENDLFNAAEQRVAVAVAMYGERGSELVSYLENSRRSRELDNLVQQFYQMALHDKFKFGILCYYERQPTDLTRVYQNLPNEFARQLKSNRAAILVGQHSACLPGQKGIGLDVRHGMLNKYRGPDDGSFTKVSFRLKEFAENALRRGPDAWIRNNHYTADRLNIERLSGQTLPMEQCYINLAIVQWLGGDAAQSKESPDKGDTPKSSPFSLSSRLKIETPYEDIQVKLAEIFDPRKDPHGRTTSPRRILIRGRAGVGKTTLCKKMVHDFLRGTWKDLFDRILWVPVRNLKARDNEPCNFEELFGHEYFYQHPNEDKLRLAQQLRRELDNRGDRTLFILDGLDEVAQDLDPKTNKFHFFLELLNQPNVIITSRPSSSLPNGHAPLDLELETIGFYPDQVKDYIEKVFHNNPQKADEIQSFLQQRLLIQNLVRIPIQLDALCYTWDTWDTWEVAIPGHIPETMTAVYQAIEQHLWEKDVVRLGKRRESYEREDLPAEISANIKAEAELLGCLAFTGLHGDIMEFQPSHLEAISERLKDPKANFSLISMLKNVSFLRTSDPLAKGQSYHFLHLTFQEYFAARYFVQQWASGERIKYLVFGRKTRKLNESEPIGFLQKHKYHARYDVFWRFVAGLLDDRGDEEQLSRFFQTIEDEPRDLLGPVHQRLIMHCLGEVGPPQDSPKWKELREGLEGQLKEWLLFECSLRREAHLAREVEFPEKSLREALDEAPDDKKAKILQSLQRRPIIPPGIICLVLPWLENSESSVLVRSVLEVLGVLGKQSDLSDELLSVVAQRLDHQNWDIRRAAVEFLGKRSDPSDKLLSAVSQQLDHQDWWVRHAAVEVLGKRPNLSDELLSAVAQRLDHQDGYIRRAAVEVLEKQSDLSDELLSVVAQRLDHQNEDVRLAAVEVLGKRPDPSDKLLSAVVQRLDDQDGDVRLAAVKVLGKRSDLSDELLSAVAQRLDHQDGYIRLAAVKVFGEQSDLSDDVLSAVAQRLDDQNEDVRLAAVEVLGKRSDLSDKLLSAVAQRLDHQEWYVRLAAVKVLGKRSDLSDELLSAVAQRLDDQNQDVRHAAVEVLGKRSDLSDKLLSATVQQLDHQDGYIRLAAVMVLGKQSDLSDELLLAVAQQLDHQDGYIRRAAVEVLGKRSDLSDELLSVVAQRLDHQDGDVRLAALKVLGKRSDLSDELLSAVAQRLDHQDGYIRRAAVEVLGKRSDLSDELLSVVAQRLDHQDGDVRLAALKVLGKRSDLSDELLSAVAQRLDDQNEDVRRAAVKVLGKRSDLSDELLLAVAQRLDRQDEDVRLAAVKVFGEQSDLSDELLSAVAQRLDDQDEDVRLAAVEVLGKRSDLSDELLSAVAQRLDDQEWYVRRAAVEVLGKRSDLSDELLSAVAQRLDHQNEDVRRATVEVLGKQSDLSDELLSAVAQRLDDQEWYVRRAAVEVLGKRSDLSDELLSAVAQRLDDQDGYIRLAAVKVLGKRSDLSDELLSAVAQRLDDQNEDVRRATVEVLGKRSDLSDELLSAVAQRFDDQEWYVRRAAVEVLGKRSDLSDELLSAVAQRLDDQEWYVRRAAVEVLGKRPNLSDELLSAVAQRLDDQDEDVRLAAVEVLGKRSDLSDELLSAVAQRLDDRERPVRHAAVKFLRKRSDPSDKLLSAIAQRLDHQNWDIRRATVEVLGKRSDLSDELLSAVAQRLDDQEWYVRRAAVEVLGKQSDLSDELLSAVAQRLDHQDGYIRRAAVEVLGKRSDLSDELLSVVAQRLDHQNVDIRRAAVKVLGEQSDLSDELLSAVAQQLNDQQWYVRHAAVKVLGKRPNLSDELLSAVAQRLDDQERHVRHAAVDVLGKRSDLSDRFLSAAPSSSVIGPLYRTLLRLSFEEPWSCHIENGLLCVNRPNGVSNSRHTSMEELEELKEFMKIAINPRPPAVP